MRAPIDKVRSRRKRAMRWSATFIGMMLCATIAVASMMMFSSTSACAADATALLIEQGKYWQAHGRGDLAAQSWEKLLAIDPHQADALFGMGIVAADRGEPEQARTWLEKLRRAAPSDINVDTLAGRLGQPSATETALKSARAFARDGKPTQAVDQYREALRGKTMSPQLSLEYYQTLGGTPQGWDEARRGLEKLAHDAPNDRRVALALAQQLSYRELTRRQGIQSLARLATSDTDAGMQDAQNVKAAARASWRQALIWMDGRVADTGLYDSYMKAAPGDTEVQAHFDAVLQQEKNARATSVANTAANAAAGARGKAVAAGFAALQSGDLESATARFKGILAERANDIDALGGMGIVRLRQEKFDDAQRYLTSASRGPDPGRWRKALDSATYWTLVNQASTARRAGQWHEARELLERAIRTDASDITAQTALGDVLLASGSAKAAESAYRMALRRQSDNPQAMRGVITALTQQGRGQEALSFASQLSDARRESMGGMGTLRAQQLQVEARAAEQAGDLTTARADLENAIASDPQSPWIRLDLARLYRQLGAQDKARSLMDGLLASNPDLPDALYASALLYGDMNDWRRVLDTLSRITANERTHDMATLQRRAWVHANVDQAVALAARRDEGARSLFAQAEKVAGSDADLIAVVANGYVQAHDDQRAIAMMRGLLRQGAGSGRQADIDLKIQYAAILMRTGQDAELGSVLQQLQALRLSTAQGAEVSKVQQGLAIRQADALRTRGDLAAAYDAIAPALAANRNDAALQSALARMYAAAGEYDQALRLYTTAHQRHPNDLDLTLAAAETAAQAKNSTFAEEALASALRQAPRDPRVLATAGRIYRAQGKPAQAAAYFREALAAESAQRGSTRQIGQAGADGFGRAAVSTYAGARAPDNPFIGRRPINPLVARSTQSPDF